MTDQTVLTLKVIGFFVILISTILVVGAIAEPYQVWMY